MTAIELDKKWFPEAISDIKNLPSRRLQEIVISRILKIAKGECEGALLEERIRTGDLSDCRKEYFDEVGGRPPAWRLVFRFLPDDRQRIAVEVIAVGRRADLEVYMQVAQRLNR